MSNALNKQGVEAHYTINEKIKDVKIDKNTICVFIKVVWPDTFNRAQQAGAHLVYDIVDNWTWSNLNHPWDCVIASNKAHKAHIESLVKSKVVIIPHLHTNIIRRRKEIKKILTIGYIGLDKQFSITADATRFCKKAALKWYQASGGDAKTVEKETMILDLGLIYATPAMNQLGLKYDYIIKYKPATKLINLFSYGIPALFNPTTAFLEVIEQDEKLKYLIVNSKEEMFKKVWELKNDLKKFNILSDHCYGIAEKYHSDHASEYYKLV
jgi:hypothetical protein